MMLKESINISLRLTLVLLLFLSAFQVKPEFFNGMVTGKQYGLELVVACIAVFMIFTLPFTKTMRISRVDAGIIVFSLWYLLGEIIIGFLYYSPENTVFIITLYGANYLFIRQSSGKPVFI